MNMNAERAPLFPSFSRVCKTGVDWRRILCGFVRETVMTSFRFDVSLPRAAIAAAAIVTSTTLAFASQGPGGGLGTASHLTQVAMAVLVYGTSAIILSAGLIGAARGRSGIWKQKA